MLCEIHWVREAVVSLSSLWTMSQDRALLTTVSRQYDCVEDESKSRTVEPSNGQTVEQSDS